MAERDQIARFFPDSFVQILDEAHGIQARLHHVESLLRNVDRVREWLRDERENEQDISRNLKARHSELLERMDQIDAAREARAQSAATRPALTARAARRPMIEVTNASIQYPFPCAPSQGSVPVPAALEGTSVVPGGSASGAITTIPTFNPYEAAEPHYEGVLRVGLKFPLLFDLSYWLHNWRYVIPFPCVPCDGRLTYRVYFETGGLFGASALSASLSNWINVREIADVSAGIDFTTLPDYEVWPLNRNWPLIAGFAAEEIWAGVTLEGGFAVKRGKAPVLAIIVGVIVGLAGGRFTIFNAGFHPWEMQLFPPGGYPEN
jgi:hypothetical protein